MSAEKTWHVWGRMADYVIREGDPLDPNQARKVATFADADDAHLASAAPDLLREAEILVDAIELVEWIGFDPMPLRAAIAKARGAGMTLSLHGRWVRSTTGTLARLEEVAKPDPERLGAGQRGQLLYVLHFESGTKGGRYWTARELEAAGATFCPPPGEQQADQAEIERLLGVTKTKTETLINQLLS